MFRRLTSLIALTCLLALSIAATASADVRYAEPGGNGAPVNCLQSDPCDLEDATSPSLTDDGDEVILLPGVYSMGSTAISIQDDINVHGVAAEPSQTRILGTSSIAVFLQSTGAKLSNVQIEGSGSLAAIYITDGVLDRVIALSSNGYGCLMAGAGTVSNSVCKSTLAALGVGMSHQNSSAATYSVSIRGSLLIGASGGLSASATSAGGSTTIDVLSSILISTDGGSDALANATNASSSVNLDLDYSNFDSVAIVPASPGTMNVTAPGTSSNQTAAALFVDEVGNDFHQAPGSPTINAGAIDGLSGLLDLYGETRSSGSAPDIGPDEIIESALPLDPPKTPPPATDTTAPVTKIKKRPKKKSKTRKAVFVFSTTEPGLTFKCKLDKAKYRPCKSRFTKTVKRGKHKLSVIATDTAGNSDATPATYSWRVL